VARLTAREREVLDATLAGWSTAEIARRLGLSPVTVRRHAASAVRKLDLPSRAALHSVATASRAQEPRLAPAPDGEAPLAEVRPALSSPLTRRQLDVLRLVAAGMPNQEIAAELVIAPNTVKNHVTRVLEKLGARNRADAVMLAARHGWL
jgi:DNA-binding NarL/FixJ family response regulator